MLPGRQYLMKINNQSVVATVTDLKYKINVHNFAQEAGKTLTLNEIGVGNLSLAKPVPFDAYKDNRQTGGFVLIDRQSNNTVAAGMLEFSLRRAANVVWQDLEIAKAERASQKHQRPAVLWFTGLSAPASLRSRIWLRNDCLTSVVIHTRWMATMSGTVSTRIWALKTPTGWRISGGSRKFRG